MAGYSYQNYTSFIKLGKLETGSQLALSVSPSVGTLGTIWKTTAMSLSDDFLNDTSTIQQLLDVVFAIAACRFTSTAL